MQPPCAGVNSTPGCGKDESRPHPSPESGCNSLFQFDDFLFIVAASLYDRGMKRILGVAGALLLAVSVASCGSTGPVAQQSESATPTPSPKPTTYYGETATAIAARIPDCTDIKAGDVAKGGPDLASIGSCVLGGRTVDVYSWADSSAEVGMAEVMEANKEAVTYARGTGWTAFVRRDMTFQWQLTNQADNLAAAAFDHASPAAPDLPGELEVSKKIADALGGRVTQYQP